MIKPSSHKIYSHPHLCKTATTKKDYQSSEQALMGICALLIDVSLSPWIWDRLLRQISKSRDNSSYSHSLTSSQTDLSEGFSKTKVSRISPRWWRARWPAKSKRGSKVEMKQLWAVLMPCFILQECESTSMHKHRFQHNCVLTED